MQFSIKTLEDFINRQTERVSLLLDGYRALDLLVNVGADRAQLDYEGAAKMRKKNIRTLISAQTLMTFRDD